MSHSDPCTPTKARLAELHARLITGDLGAADEICRLMHPVLSTGLRRWAFSRDPHEICTAVNDALVSYLKNPGLFDPHRGPLENLLLTIALNRLRDLRRRVRRRAQRELSTGVDLSLLAGTEIQTSASEIDLEELVVAYARDPVEGAFLRARLAGASLAEQAAALGAGDVPANMQRLMVYRATERIARRTRRKRETRRVARPE